MTVQSRISSGAVNRLPSWFRQDIPDEKTLKRLEYISGVKVNTVCKSAKCPNISDCLKHYRLTFMILGDVCTRNCRFCAVNKFSSQNGNLAIDVDEPLRISRLVKQFGLDYVVITSVTRDDLSDGGAGEFARTVELIHQIKRSIKVEVLIPDFLGNIGSLEAVINSGPCVIGHNIETVRSLYKELKPESDYDRSIAILRKVKQISPLMVTKSAFLLGMGEREDELISSMEDLRAADCDILFLGQYLSAGSQYYPVKEFVAPEQFERYQEIGLSMGFKIVLAGPRVRSSYRAEEVYKKLW
ncbi:MAG: lipoyl synthase [Candidatus Omnitrophota bacterium]